jgi:hypothetical protein
MRYMRDGKKQVYLVNSVVNYGFCFVHVSDHVPECLGTRVAGIVPLTEWPTS